jgi:hypothetical protein
MHRHRHTISHHVSIYRSYNTVTVTVTLAVDLQGHWILRPDARR